MTESIFCDLELTTPTLSGYQKYDSEVKPQACSIPTPMATPVEEVDFPRGGQESLSVGERKRLRQEAFREANADFLAGDFSTKKRQKKKSRQDNVGRPLIYG